MESKKWKDDGPLFVIDGWPIVDTRPRYEAPQIDWDSPNGFDAKREYERQFVESCISSSSDSIDYFPEWNIHHRYNAFVNLWGGSYNALPPDYMLDYPISTGDLPKQIRFFTNHGMIPREYFCKRLRDEGAVNVEKRVIETLKTLANVDIETELAKRYIENAGKRNLRTDLSSGDVYEIYDNGHYYYFQVIRQLNFHCDHFLDFFHEMYRYMVKLVYARFDKRPDDLDSVLRSCPSQTIVSGIDEKGEMEFVGNYEILSEWRDEDPPFFLLYEQEDKQYADLDEVKERPTRQWQLIVRGDRSFHGVYRVVRYRAGYRFPTKYRRYPIYFDLGCLFGTPRFSAMAPRGVDFYLANGKFFIDAVSEAWTDEFFLTWMKETIWTDRQIVEERRKRKQDSSMEFVPYKYTSSDVRRRVKKLVNMQRRRKQFSEETLVEFEEILNEFVDNIVGKKDDKKNIRKWAKTAIRKLNRANKKLDHSLIETQERDELFQFFFDAGCYVGVDIFDVVDETRDW